MLKLYNTLTRKLETFKSIHNKQVGLYTCGPTVYFYAHIGNLRTYLFEDIVRRTLEYLGFTVNHVMNITDVGHLTGDRDMGEDKVEQQARKQQKSALEITEQYTEAFFKDIESLNILKPHITEKATDTINEQILIIKNLEKKGYAYTTSDGVYFDTSQLLDYGKLANLDIEGLREGARVEKNYEKKNSTDFALWKFSYPNGRPFDESQDNNTKRRQMEWDSPWGTGFPGWHIECSAISTKHLGQPFDIHAGGIDHVPVHHTNEIAQSEAAYRKPLAQYWLHGEFLNINDGRMGKSEGNLITLKTLIDKGYDPLAYRYLLLGTHYRQKQNFTWEALNGAQNALNKLYDIVSCYEEARVGCAEYEQQFKQALEDDFNTPQALAVMWKLIKSDYPDSAKKATLLKFDQVLALKLSEVKKEELVVPEDVQRLLEKRQNAREKKDFELSDELREQIIEKGFSVEDTPEGQKLKSVREYTN